jgi:hypothetical protein
MQVRLFDTEDAIRQQKLEKRSNKSLRLRDSLIENSEGDSKLQSG